MSTPTVEERLSVLEQQVAELKANQNGSHADWRKAIGWAKDDPGYDEMAKLGADYRESLKDEEDAG